MRQRRARNLAPPAGPRREMSSIEFWDTTGPRAPRGAGPQGLPSIPGAMPALLLPLRRRLGATAHTRARSARRGDPGTRSIAEQAHPASMQSSASVTPLQLLSRPSLQTSIPSGVRLGSESEQSPSQMPQPSPSRSASSSGTDPTHALSSPSHSSGAPGYTSGFSSSQSSDSPSTSSSQKRSRSMSPLASSPVHSSRSSQTPSPSLSPVASSPSHTSRSSQTRSPSSLPAAKSFCPRLPRRDRDRKAPRADHETAGTLHIRGREG